jgi:hypothetical protein
MVMARYNRGSAQMEAVEMQWAAYQFNQSMQRIDTSGTGALKPSTVQALREAETYCWSSLTTETVASLGQEMPGECALNPTSLGDLYAAPRTAGWWWFQDPLPIKTTARSADADPVVALLWQRYADDEHGLHVWFSTMVMHPLVVNGRLTSIPVPTIAWRWQDGYTLDALPEALGEGFAAAFSSQGDDAATVKETAAAALWFSRFFLAAVTWLRERIIVPAPAEGVRQAVRRVQREYKLATAPKVRIIELRRAERQMVARAREAAAVTTDGKPRRQLHCQFVVGGLLGFMRNQWYPSRKEHAPKWIAPFWKGPKDAEVKVGPRVYAVRR